MKTPLQIIFLSLIIVFLFQGCTKQKNLNLDLTFVDSETSEPVQAGVWVHYGDLYEQFGEYGEIYLGHTDQEGHLKVTRDMGKKGNCYLFIYGDEFHTHCMNLQYGIRTKQVGVVKGQKVKATIKLDPVYHYKLHIKNVNCFNQTDSVWISVNNQQYMPKYTLDGCVDMTVQYGFNSVVQGISYTSASSLISFHIKVKRNGQITEYDETKQLTRGMITPISIEY